MWLLVLGLVIFIGIHSVRMVAPDWRENFIASKGAGAWQGLYSVVSLVSFALIVWGFGLARPDTEFLYLPPDGAIYVTMLLMLVAFILLVAGNLPTGHIKRILVHPMITAVVIWAAVHLMMNGDTVSLLLFGVFLIWAVWNRISVSRRPSPSFETVSVKFDIIAIVVGTGFWLAFIMGLHGWLFGVEVIA